MDNVKAKLESNLIAEFMLDKLCLLPPVVAANVVQTAAKKALEQHNGYGFWNFFSSTNLSKSFSLEAVYDEMNKAINDLDKRGGGEKEKEKGKMLTICEAIKRIAMLGHFHQGGVAFSFKYSSFNTKFIQELWGALKLKILEAIHNGVNEGEKLDDPLCKKLLQYENYETFNAASVADKIYNAFESKVKERKFLLNELYNIIEKDEEPNMM